MLQLERDNAKIMHAEPKDTYTDKKGRESFRKKERERRDKHIQVSKHEYQIYIVIARHHNRMVVDADVFPLFLNDHYGPSRAVTAEVKPTATTASWGRYRREYKVPVGNIQGEFIC